MRYYILDCAATAKGRSGESIGSEYTLDNACPACGTGAKYIGRYRIDMKPNKDKDVFLTFDWDLIISERLYQKLIKAKCNVMFPETEDKRENALPYRHFTSKFELPSVSESPTLRIEPTWQCSVCKQNGWLGDFTIDKGETKPLPYFLIYKNIPEQLLIQSDVFITWERFGKTSIVEEGIYGIRFPRPLIIVAENVKSILETADLRFRFEQIEIR